MAGVTAALAQVSFNLPYTPVPFTLQVLGVVLSGMLLGSRMGALAQIEYLMLGFAGAPVFAGWHGGIMSLVGPSGGYLPGFVVGAFITGLIVERSREKTAPHAFAAGMAGVAALYMCGVSWLTVWVAATGMASPSLSALFLGIVPFIGFDAIKVTVAAMIATGGNRWRV